MRQLRTLAASLFAVALAATPALAQPTRIDFSEFRSPITTEYQATPGGDVTSKGFDFLAAFGTGARNALGTWGTDDGELSTNLPTNLGPTAAAMWGTQFGERIDMRTTSGLRFGLFSMDVAHMYSREFLLSGDLSPITLVFFGFQGGATNSLSASFTIPLPPIVGGVRQPALNTLAFSEAWRGLTSVVWFQQSGSGTTATTGSAVSHQFTNVLVEVVPEPSTYAMLGVGLGGVLLVARRRRVS